MPFVRAVGVGLDRWFDDFQPAVEVLRDCQSAGFPRERWPVSLELPKLLLRFLLGFALDDSPLAFTPNVVAS